MFTTLKVTADTTMSQARRTKKKSGRHGCALCMKMFKDFQGIRKHVTKKKHRADAKELKADLDTARAALEEDREDPCNVHNYRLAVVKKAFLETFGGRR